MSTQFAEIAAEHRAFIARQKIFFVASAAPTGRVSVSPKGMSAFRVLGDNDAAYLDCTGSGSETRAHLMASDDRRLTMSFARSTGTVILRLYGQAESLMRGTPGYDGIIHLFDEMPGARQIVRLSVDLVQTSCGLASRYSTTRRTEQDWPDTGRNAVTMSFVRIGLGRILGASTDSRRISNQKAAA